MAETYTCAQCGGTFEKGVPDEEALAEMEQYFGEVPESERRIVCDDCFQVMHPLDHPEQVEAAKQELIAARWSKAKKEKG